ncbi:hypothetical protein ACQEU5_02180 [Marinactinospora thermotolerans]|uniref:Uncharacterized protein n=1 Tax=Marinactinospora thermotolerans DSM 45154 TaxID=1122192 RepID=A0A1T4LYQ3_9ACTN|nr:hypothetical protein [Marinactinospora thermotolerans]SJZ59850.1 hypothetical protein SAMN02745673_00873 [Marinactinospora thermotolerans DSM 45154]
MVLRNYWTASAGVAASVFISLLYLMGFLVMGEENGGLTWGDMFVGSALPSIFVWFFFKVAFFAHIETVGNSVVVKNLFSKTVIPARMINRVTYEGGVEIFTRPGRSYGSLNLGGSVLGALAGYPTNRRCAEKLIAFLESRDAGDGVEGVTVTHKPHFNILFLCSVFCVFFVIHLLLRAAQ